MDRNELISFLKSLKVNDKRYSFDEINNSDCISLVYNVDCWNIYYTERDQPELIGKFSNENKANLFVANEFKRNYLD